MFVRRLSDEDVKSYQIIRRGFPPKVWGPIFWRFIHHSSFHISNNANQPLYSCDKYAEFIGIITSILPCGKCREHYRKKNLDIKTICYITCGSEPPRKEEKRTSLDDISSNSNNNKRFQRAWVQKYLHLSKTSETAPFKTYMLVISNSTISDRVKFKYLFISNFIHNQVNQKLKKMTIPFDFVRSYISRLYYNKTPKNGLRIYLFTVIDVLIFLSFNFQKKSDSTTTDKSTLEKYISFLKNHLVPILDIVIRFITERSLKIQKKGLLLNTFIMLKTIIDTLADKLKKMTVDNENAARDLLQKSIFNDIILKLLLLSGKRNKKNESSSQRVNKCELTYEKFWTIVNSIRFGMPSSEIRKLFLEKDSTKPETHQKQQHHFVRKKYMASVYENNHMSLSYWICKNYRQIR